MEEIEIRGEMIRLGQLLKLADLLESGAEAKDFLAAVEVLVNGEREQRRGRQLRDGDIVAIGGEAVRIRAGEPAPESAPQAAKRRPRPRPDVPRL